MRTQTVWKAIALAGWFMTAGPATGAITEADVPATSREQRFYVQFGGDRPFAVYVAGFRGGKVLVTISGEMSDMVDAATNNFSRSYQTGIFALDPAVVFKGNQQGGLPSADSRRVLDRFFVAVLDRSEVPGPREEASPDSFLAHARTVVEQREAESARLNGESDAIQGVVIDPADTRDKLAVLSVPGQRRCRVVLLGTEGDQAYVVLHEDFITAQSGFFGQPGMQIGFDIYRVPTALLTVPNRDEKSTKYLAIESEEERREVRAALAAFPKRPLDIDQVWRRSRGERGQIPAESRVFIAELILQARADAKPGGLAILSCGTARAYARRLIRALLPL